MDPNKLSYTGIHISKEFYGDFITKIYQYIGDYSNGKTHQKYFTKIFWKYKFYYVRTN